MNFLVFFISAFCVYRVADILSSEEGPGAIFSKLRRKVPAKTNAGRGVRCPYCVGIWISALTTGWLWHLGEVEARFSVIYGFGLAGCAALIRKGVG